MFGGLPNGDGVAPIRRERTTEVPRKAQHRGVDPAASIGRRSARLTWPAAPAPTGSYAMPAWFDSEARRICGVRLIGGDGWQKFGCGGDGVA